MVSDLPFTYIPGSDGANGGLVSPAVLEYESDVQIIDGNLQNKTVTQKYRITARERFFPAIVRLLKQAEELRAQKTPAETNQAMEDEVALLRKRVKELEAADRDWRAQNLALNSKHKELSLERDTQAAEIINLRNEKRKK